MPTTSPIKKNKLDGNTRYPSPTRLVEPDDLTPPVPLQPHAMVGLRLRADTDGSTNNAFFRDGHPPLPPAVKPVLVQMKKEKTKKEPQKRKKSRKPKPDVELGASKTNDVNKKKKNQPRALPGALETILDTSMDLVETSADGTSQGKRQSSGVSDFRSSDFSNIMGADFIDDSMGGDRLSELLKESSACEHEQVFSKDTTKKEANNKDDFSFADEYSDTSFDFDDDYYKPSSPSKSVSPDREIWGAVQRWFNPSPWLIHDVKFDDGGTPYYDPANSWTAAGFVRHYLYNPISPEFTSLQQFVWAVVIGIAMGIYTAVWKMLIESGVDFIWEAVPEILLELGVFTDLSGSFPLYHYMWICPTLFGGVLSYIFCILPVPIPGQNEWIKSLHARGVQDYRTFWPLFILATLGMMSGLSLGPELPLVLTAGMFGSWLGIVCQQSMLQARVLNLTAASAAVGGFFGFPMAGALFVLEVPHRMGLQYFEALSPATISSIIAVIANRIITRNDVTGYFKYPFLSNSLPSSIFTHAIVYGLYGSAIGIIYAVSILKLKGYVHDWFHAPHDHHEEELHIDDDGSVDYHYSPEKKPLVEKSYLEKEVSRKSAYDRPAKSIRRNMLKRMKKLCTFIIPYEPYRASVAGAIAGLICGLIGMYVPHTLFWGEAQLQNLIDKGRTPLPIFGQGDDPTADLTALGFCMIDPTNPEAIKAGFSIECSILLAVSKTIVIGLSVGTGIVGGHFWGPLFIGCAASHLLADVMHIFQEVMGFGGSLAAYPCLIILCVMGSAHVVTFRAHTAIMLILTLTISSFTSEDAVYSVAGDYSAVFPLLVISVFVSLMVSRTSIVFYKEQRSRGDITAVPEVLCEPGMAGRPLVHAYEGDEFDELENDDENNGDHDYANIDIIGDLPSTVITSSHDLGAPPTNYRPVPTEITQEEIEKAFSRENSQSRGVYGSVGDDDLDPYSFVLPGTQDSKPAAAALSSRTSAFSRLDELLSAPIDPDAKKHLRGSPNSLSAMNSNTKEHRRVQSFSAIESRARLNMKLERKDSSKRFESPTGNRERANSRGSRGSIQMRVESFGELHDHQPPLLEQARLRAASRELIEIREQREQEQRQKEKEQRAHRRSPSMPSRSKSNNSMVSASVRRSRANSGTGAPSDPIANMMCSLSLDEIEESFNAAFNHSSVLQKK